MANLIARLGVVLGLDSAEFTKGIEGASKKLDQFAQSAVTYGKVAATALTAASIAALKYADDIVDVAKANDVAIDSVVKLSNALALSGGKSDDAGKLLASFTGFVDKAAEGSLEAQKTFSKLGVSLKDLGQLSSAELFDKTVRALANIEDPITRNAKAMEVLGKAAKGVDIRELLSQMEEGQAIAEKQAKAIEDAAAVYDEITKAGQQFMLMLATELGPVLKATIDYMKDMKGSTFEVGPVFRTVFETIAVSAANASFAIKTVILDLMAFNNAAYAVLNFKFGDAKKIFLEAINRAEQDRAALDQFERRIFGTTESQPSASTTPKPPPRGGRVVTPPKTPEDDRRRREEEREREKREKEEAADREAISRRLGALETDARARASADARRDEREEHTEKLLTEIRDELREMRHAMLDRGSHPEWRR